MAFYCNKKTSALSRGITWKNNSNFYCLNCLRLFRTKTKLNSHKNVCENKDFSSVVMPSEDTKIMRFNQYQKSDKTPLIIHADLEFLIKNDPQKLFTTKVSEHMLLCFSMFLILSFKTVEDKCDVYKGKDCIKKVCESLSEHTMKIIDLK